MAKDESPMVAAVSLLLMPWHAILRGLTLAKLWAWFVVAKFQLPPLRIPEALGLCLVVSFAVSRTATKEELDKPLWQLIGQSAGECIIALGMGWIYLRFI